MSNKYLDLEYEDAVQKLEELELEKKRVARKLLFRVAGWLLACLLVTCLNYFLLPKSRFTSIPFYIPVIVIMISIVEYLFDRFRIALFANEFHGRLWRGKNSSKT